MTPAERCERAIQDRERRHDHVAAAFAFPFLVLVTWLALAVMGPPLDQRKASPYNALHKEGE